MDANLIIDPDVKQQLMDGGMDSLLAGHFAHLFIRDPIVIFNEDLQELDLEKSDHFENLQSTNWQHIRFKPPPSGSDIGWRVEFRPMEIQITDFENAAFSVFMVLITRAILSFDLSFYIPISKTDENMETAHKRDAVRDSKFYFRKDIFPRRYPRSYASGANSPSGVSTPRIMSRPPTPTGPIEDEYVLMGIDEIMNGSKLDSENSFPGLIPVVESYLDSMNVDVETRCELARYLSLIRQRANGSLWTAAKWIREYVKGHKGYEKDSVVSEKLNHDLIGEVIAIEKGEMNGKVGRDVEKFLGSFIQGSKD